MAENPFQSIAEKRTNPFAEISESRKKPSLGGRLAKFGKSLIEPIPPTRGFFERIREDEEIVKGAGVAGKAGLAGMIPAVSPFIGAIPEETAGEFVISDAESQFSPIGLIGNISAGGAGMIKALRFFRGLKPAAQALEAAPKMVEGVPRVAQQVEPLVRKAEEVVTFGAGLKNKERWIDRFASLAHLTDVFEQAVGRKALPAEDVFRGARLYAGIPGRIRARVREVGGIINKKVKPAEFDDLSQVLVAERNSELAAQGRGLATEAKIRLRSGKVVEVQTADELQVLMGPDKYNRLRQTADEMTEFNNRVLLADLKDSGVLSQADTNKILNRNQKYIPFEVIQDLADDLVEEGGVRFGRRSFQVATQDVLKRLKGGAQILEDPLLAQMGRVAKVSTLAQRNRVGRSIQAMADILPDGKKFVKPLAKEANAEKGFSEFKVFVDGNVQKFQVPTMVSEALKGLTESNIDMITRFASIGSRALRFGATSASFSFALTNPIRDAQLAALVSKQMGIKFNPMTWTKGFANALKKGPLYDKFEEGLGSFGGFFSRLSGGGVKGLAAEAIPTTGQKIAKVANTTLNPIEWIRKTGETLELAPRLAIFEQAIKQGKTIPEASFASRNASIDFARMGTAMKMANLWVPFLNARLQGTINAGSASLNLLKNNPAALASTLGGMIVAPLMGTFAWNTAQFSDVWDEIQDWEKEQNFMLIYGRDKDEEGRYTQVLKVPKGDVGRVFGNPIEAFLEFWRGEDPKSLSQTVVEAFSDVSPVSFAREGKISGSRALSDILPPTAKAALFLSGAVNKDLFTGFPIVDPFKEGLEPHVQVRRSTPRFLRQFAETDIGKTLKVSPSRTEAALRAQFGGLGADVPGTIEALQGGRGRTPLTSAFRRFRGASGGRKERQEFDRRVQINRKVKTEREEARLDARDLLVALKKTRSEGQRKTLVQKALDRNPLIKDVLSSVARKESTPAIDRFTKAMSIAGRAEVIADKLARLKTPEEKAAFLQEMVQKKILTKKVMELLKIELADQ